MDIFKGKTILITGGTGFLGRSLTKRLLTFDPHAIRIFSRDEVKHHKVQQMFNNHPSLRHFIGDVRDLERLRKATSGCDIVIHAAALKRIDLIEYNVSEAIKTNILGTLNLIEACIENKVKKVIFISTDKACEPVNSYGACKFVSERIFTESNFSKGGEYPKFICVRYGNVMNSTGSVIPFFLEKIQNQQKVPLTHPEMTRFAITVDKAVDLVLDAIQYGDGGEVFVPKLPAFKITQLIQVISEILMKPCDIEVVGIRPGEKIHELMINESEINYTYDFRDYYVITSQIQKHKGSVLAYILAGKKLDPGTMKEYSSKDSVVSDELVKEIVQKEITESMKPTFPVVYPDKIFEPTVLCNQLIDKN